MGFRSVEGGRVSLVSNPTTTKKWNNIAEESKESVPTIPVMTSNETNQRVALSDEASGSNADTADAPQGDHRGTSSSSSGVERSGEASGSNAVTTDAPEGEASGSNAGAPGAPQDDHRITMPTLTPMLVENIPSVMQRNANLQVTMGER